MNEKMIEAAIEGNFTEFSDMLKEELNRRVHELIESRIQDVTDATWNVCESCDEDDVWDDDDVEALYDDEEDPYEDEEDLQGMNIGEGDDHDTRELHLYASNHADLHRQRMTPIHKNLRNKQASGTYDSEKAHKAFGHAAKDAADRYHKDHGHRFSTATRKAVAGKMRDEFESDSKAGEHDHLLHKKHKGHKVGESVEDMNEMPLVGTRSISRDEYKAMLAKAGTTRSSMKAKVKKGREDAKKSSETKKEEVELDELMMPAKDSEGRIQRGKIRAALRRGGQRARDAADKHYDAAANTHPDDHKGFVSSTQKAVDKDKVAKRRERAAEEVSVDEAMGGKLKDVRKQAAKNQKKRKKGEKLAKKDHDGDGKIETGSQEFMGSRDKAIKSAIAARKGN